MVPIFGSTRHRSAPSELIRPSALTSNKAGLPPHCLVDNSPMAPKVRRETKEECQRGMRRLFPAMFRNGWQWGPNLAR